jgi:hypothetical protein
MRVIQPCGAAATSPATPNTSDWPSQGQAPVGGPRSPRPRMVAKAGLCFGKVRGHEIKKTIHARRKEYAWEKRHKRQPWEQVQTWESGQAER